MKTKESFNKEVLDPECTNLSFTMVRYNEDLVSPWHYHEKAYFTFIRKGGNIERRKDRAIECKQGMLFFYNSDDLHYNEKGKMHSSNFNIEIDDDWFKKYEIDRTKIEGTLLLTDTIIKTTFIKIMAETLQRDSFSKLAIEGYLLEIFAKLLRVKSLTTLREPNWVKKVRNYLSSHDLSNVTLNCISSQAGLHPVTVSKEFPRFFGVGFAEYIRNIKCETALQMLGKNSLPLTEIAIRSGFSDASHLIKIFRKKYKMTPAQYRSQF